jgi:aminoglycoside 6-adenylyltransferase
VANWSKSEIGKSYEKLVERFHKWAEGCADIRTAAIIGSRARADHPADEWADLDVIIVTTEAEHYVSTSDWTSDFGKPLLTFIEPASAGDEKERRVLYEGMLDVDFAIIPLERVQRLFETMDRTIESEANAQVLAQISNLLGRGVRVLVDKDGTTNQLNAFAGSIEKMPLSRPTQAEFLELMNDFFYHAVFTAKHLRRGELWWTVTCLDCYMQHLLLRVIEWHALATHDWKYDTWFRGRFLEKWASPKAVKGLYEAFGRYNGEDIKCALLAAIDLFRLLATETATKLGYPYPTEADKTVTAWITACISEVSNSRR